MKSSLLLFTFGLLLCAHAVRDKAFRARREYVYQYETQLVTGMEPFTSVHSGFRLSAAARVQFVTLSKARVQLDKLIIYRLNKPVVQYQADSNILPEQFLSELAGEETDKIIKYLKIPFGFQYVKGHVVKVLLSDEETEWSANAKRGFTSLFEMNLEKRMLLQEFSQSPDNSADQRVENYKVIERSVTGDCATTYTVKPRLSENHFFVSKVRDFETCLDRPVFFETMFDGYVTPTHQKDNPLSTAATVEYSLSGGHARFLILSAIAQTKFTYTPIGQKGDIRTSVNQTLYLKEARPIVSKSAIPKVNDGHRKSDTLRMTLPSKPVDPQDPFQPSIEEPKQNEDPSDVYPVNAIYTQLIEAAENTQRLTSQEALVRLRAVVDMLKTSPEDVIRELWQKVYPSNDSHPQDQLAAKALWNVLPDVGTEAAAAHVLNVCTKDKTMRTKCNTALNVVTLKVAPTPKIIEKIITMIDTQATKGTPDRFTQVSYLTLGSFGYKISLAKYWKMEEIKQAKEILNDLRGRESNKFLRKYLAVKRRDVNNKKNRIINVHAQTNHKIVETIKKLIDEGTQTERILGLKSLANAGETESLPILRNILTNRKEPLLIRIFAVIGYRRMFVEEAARQEAIGTLLSVYRDNKEMNEIRTMAFTILMGLWPEEAVLTSIAQSLHAEKDVQVSQYVTSYLASVANSSYTAVWEVNKNCRDALKFAPPNYNADFYHSFIKSIGTMFPDFKAGVDFRVKSLGSMHRYEGWTFDIDTYIYGLHSSFFEMGINSDGLGHFFNKLFGPKGLLSYNRRAPPSASPSEVIDNIFKTLKIKARTESVPTAHLYYKLMGHELGYFDFTDILDAISDNGQAAVQFDPEQLKAGLDVHFEDLLTLHDTQLTLPSEAGLPVSLKLQLSTTVKVDGQVTADLLPFFFPADREGQAPSTLTASVDIKPKIVTALYGSMGLDWHHVKPSVAFRGLVKNSMPIRNDMVYEMATQEFKLINFVPKQSKPIMEVLIEPFGEFQTFNPNPKAPTVRVDRTPIFSPVGTKTTPLNIFYNINVLGYKIGVQGQIPDSRGLKAPVRPLSGRTVLNFYLSPLDQAPDSIIVEGQVFQHLHHTSEADNVDDTSVKTDKFGRPVSPFMQESPSLSDPADLGKKTASLRHLVAKTKNVTGKTIHTPYTPDGIWGLTISADASKGEVTRKSHFDCFWEKDNGGLHYLGGFYLWRSPILGYDDQEWELNNYIEIFYPDAQYESKDIFSVEWQRELMKDLQHLVGAETHKVANEGLNRTLLSTLQQLNYPAMTRVPAYRVASALVPQVLHKLMNESGSDSSQIDWQKYWKTLEPLSRKVEEEKKLILDPTFIKRDAILISYLVELMDIQKTLRADLATIHKLKKVRHTELPVMQWVVFTQERVVYQLEEIVTRNAAKNAIARVKYITKQLMKSKKLLRSIIEDTTVVIFGVKSVSLEKDKDDRDVTVTIPELEKVKDEKTAQPMHETFDVTGQHQTFTWQIADLERQASRAYIQDPRHPDKDVRDLVQSLYRLSLLQMQVIKSVQLAVWKNKGIDQRLLYTLVNSTRENMNLFDDFWRIKPFEFEAVKERMLLATIQNEMLIDLLHRHHVLVNKGSSMHMSFLDQEIFDLFESYFVKVESYYFGQRAASTYKFSMLNDVVVQQLDDEELTVYRRVQDVFRSVAADLRLLEGNFTTRHTQRADTVFRWFTQSIDGYIAQMHKLQMNVTQFDHIPKVYLVSEMVETMNYMKFAVELARSAILPLTFEQRLFWIEALDNQATDVQVLISSMSPIFDKFSTARPRDQDSTKPSLLDVHDVNDILAKEEEIIDKLSKYLQLDQLSSKIHPWLQGSVVGGISALQYDLFRHNQRVWAIMEKSEEPDQNAVFAELVEDFKQRRRLYEKVIEFFPPKDSHIVSEMLDRHQRELSDLEPKIPKNHVDSKQTFSDDIDGINGLFQFDWGPEDDKKQAKLQMHASRSIEQIMWIFKQMDSTVRSQELIRDVNEKFGDEIYSEKQPRDVLNSYNHLHVIASLDKDSLPDWAKEYANRLHDYFKMVMWDQYSWQHPEPGTEGRIQAIVEVSDFNKKMDMILMNELETNKFRAVPLPQWLHAIRFNQNSKSWPGQVVSYLSHEYLPAKCVVKENKVRTIDSVEYNIRKDIDKCRTLLAMDCSLEKTFAITMAKSNTTRNGHALQVVSEGKIIEILPDDKSVQVLDIKGGEPKAWTPEVENELRSKQLVITREGRKVKVSLPLTGIVIVVEGSYIKVEIPQLFRNKVCGLCGNFDSQRSWEFEGPMTEVYTSPISFTTSYAMPGEPQCHINAARRRKTAEAAMAATDEFVPRYSNISHNLQRNITTIDLKGAEPWTEPAEDQPDSDEEDQEEEDDSHDVESREDDFHEPVEQTDIRERKFDQICFSITPVLKCPTEAPVVVKSRMESILYVCLDKSDSEVARLKELAAMGPVQDLDKIPGKRMRRRVRQELECEEEEDED